MRYGFEPEGDPPEVLKVLAKEGVREMFTPEMLSDSSNSLIQFINHLSGFHHGIYFILPPYSFFKV